MDNRLGSEEKVDDAGFDTDYDASDDLYTRVRRTRRRVGARHRHTPAPHHVRMPAASTPAARSTEPKSAEAGTAANPASRTRLHAAAQSPIRTAAVQAPGTGTNRQTAAARHSAVQKSAAGNDDLSAITQETAGSDAAAQESGPEKPQKKKRRHPILKLLLLLFIVCGGYFGYSYATGAIGHTAVPGYYTVAVFGVDSRNGNVGREALSDVNVIARIDLHSGEIRLVSCYRDTYSQINAEGDFHKLNEAYFRGGPEQAVWALEHNTDVRVDDYATFNWKAIADAINILGGIDLEITDAEFKYINAFITETVQSTGVGSVQLEHAGMNHLDGIQAVAYARLRLMDTDFNRTQRQRKVVSLAFEKAKNADFLTLNNILVTVLPQISTSITADDLLPFARNIRNFYMGETAGFPFDKATADVGRLDCVIPVTLESNAAKLHEFLYPGSDYTPSERLQSISNRIIRDTGLR